MTILSSCCLVPVSWMRSVVVGWPSSSRWCQQWRLRDGRPWQWRHWLAQWCILDCHPRTCAAVVDAERRRGTILQCRARTATALRRCLGVRRTAQVVCWTDHRYRRSVVSVLTERMRSTRGRYTLYTILTVQQLAYHVLLYRDNEIKFTTTNTLYENNRLPSPLQLHCPCVTNRCSSSIFNGCKRHEITSIKHFISKHR